MVSKINIENIYWELKHTTVQERGDYSQFYGHLEQTFLQGVKSECSSFPMPAFTHDFIQAFLNNMKKITMRALILEMELCSDFGELQGDTEEEQYHYFTEHFLSDPSFQKEIYKTYPLMYQDMLSSLTLSIQNICEVLERFAVDIEEINSRFFPENACHKIQKISGGDSDAHRGSRMVLVLELDNGEKLIYKPRSLALDEAYVSFLQWICQNVDMEYWWNTIWDRGEYGWCGWVSALPCQSSAAIKRYYERNGLLLCISYLLGSMDMHYENLIAHGEYPILIDLELAIGNRGLKQSGEVDEVKRIFQESVLQTGLLPMYAWNENGEGVNVGAINGGGGELVPLNVPVIANAGTTRMRVEYRQPRLKEGKNLATLNGEFIQPSEFFREIIAGFEKAYRFLGGGGNSEKDVFSRANKEAVLEKLTLFQKVQVRYLARQTQEYSMLLTTMYHPNFLAEQKEREELFQRVVLKQGADTAPETKWLHIQEVKELNQGDVPYFWYQPEERCLHSGTGEVYEKYFVTPVLQEIKERLFRMNEKERERQEKLIWTALFQGTKSKPKKETEYWKMKTKEKKEWNEKTENQQMGKVGRVIAEQVGKILLNEAIWSEDRKNIGWISIIMAGYRERGYFIHPMGLYLYDGLAGIAVFMQRLAGETGKECYREITDLLVQKLFAHTCDYSKDALAGEKPTGAFSGEASIAFAYMLLYSMEQNPEFLYYIRLQCETMSRAFEKDRHYDIIGGNAGAVLVLLAAYELTGEEQYKVWAGKAGDCLKRAATSYEWGLGWVNPITKNALTGFSHGASGVMFALAKLGYITGEKDYLDVAYKAFLFEEHYFDQKIQDWTDLRFEEEKEDKSVDKFTQCNKFQGIEPHNMAWCHGWGGIVMTRILTKKYVNGKFRQQLEQTVKGVMRYHGKGFLQDSKKNSFCLCHGKCGNAVIYAMNQWGDGMKQKEILQSEFENGSGELRDKLEIQECSNFGLMGGITGIGYYFLCGEDEVAKLLSVRI